MRLPEKTSLYVLLGSGLYLCCNLFSLKGAPFLLGGDEQYFWTGALRMGQGDLIYRDFFEFTPPGTDLVYLSAFTLFGARIWAPNVVLLLLGMSLAWLCFYISRCVMKPAAAAVAAALFLVLDFGKWLDATHHWFSLLAVMAAVAVLMRGSSARRVLIGGALCGVASFFTQTRGVGAALGLAGFLLWEGIQHRATWRIHLEQLLRLILSLVLAWLVLSSYFIFKLGFSTLFYFQTVYVLAYVINGSNSLFPSMQHPLAWPIRAKVDYFEAPIIYAISWWRSAQLSVSGSSEARPVALLAFIGAGTFLEVAQNPNVLRVDCVLLPSIILFVWLVVGLTERMREPARIRKYLTVVTWIGLICLSAHQVWTRNVANSMIVQLPAGRTAARPLRAEKLTWLARHTTPGELFFEASYGSMYLPLGLRNPAFDPLDRFTSPEFVALDLRQLAAQHVRYILWSPLDRPRYPTFEQFLFERYRPVERFSDGDEIWELK